MRIKVVAPVVEDDAPIQFIGTRTHTNGKRMNQYRFTCSSCHAEGELGVMPNKTELIKCPNHCGALFIQLPARAMFQSPRLIEVTAGAMKKARRGKEN